MIDPKRNAAAERVCYAELAIRQKFEIANLDGEVIDPDDINLKYLYDELNVALEQWQSIKNAQSSTS